VIADKVLFPGMPDYHIFVRINPNYTSALYKSELGYSSKVTDGIEVSASEEKKK
jgi:hypothetical protein